MQILRTGLPACSSIQKASRSWASSWYYAAYPSAARRIRSWPPWSLLWLEALNRQKMSPSRYATWAARIWGLSIPHPWIQPCARFLLSDYSDAATVNLPPPHPRDYHSEASGRAPLAARWSFSMGFPRGRCIRRLDTMGLVAQGNARECRNFGGRRRICLGQWSPRRGSGTANRARDGGFRLVNSLRGRLQNG